MKDSPRWITHLFQTLSALSEVLRREVQLEGQIHLEENAYFCPYLANIASQIQEYIR